MNAEHAETHDTLDEAWRLAIQLDDARDQRIDSLQKDEHEPSALAVRRTY